MSPGHYSLNLESAQALCVCNDGTAQNCFGCCPFFHQLSHGPNADIPFLLVAATAVGHSVTETKHICFSATVRYTVHGADTPEVAADSQQTLAHEES